MKVVGTWKKYNGETLYLPDGTEFTEEKMHMKYPASVVEDMAVNCVGVTMLDAKTLLYVRAEYGISEDVSDEEAFKIMRQMDEDKATESTPLERIAAVLEYLCMIVSQEKENEH